MKVYKIQLLYSYIDIFFVQKCSPTPPKKIIARLKIYLSNACLKRYFLPFKPGFPTDCTLNLGENCQDYEFMVDPKRLGWRKKEK